MRRQIDRASMFLAVSACLLLACAGSPLDGGGGGGNADAGDGRGQAGTGSTGSAATGGAGSTNPVTSGAGGSNGIAGTNGIGGNWGVTWGGGSGAPGSCGTSGSVGRGAAGAEGLFARIDGEDWYAPSASGMTSPMGLSAIGTSSGETMGVFVLWSGGPPVGPYTGREAAITYARAEPNVSSTGVIYDSHRAGDAVTITITKTAAENDGFYEGTFSGPIKRAEPPDKTVNVTDGRFKVWVP